MSERKVTTKLELLADIERAWATLNTALEQLTAAQMTTNADQQGWTVKDHISHMTAWERSVVFFLQGQPRHLALGVDEALYVNGHEDQVNAAIFQRHKDLPLDEALAQFRDVHQQLMNLVQPMTDADLHQPYRHYLPDEPGEGDGPAALDLIYGNSANHFTEHLAWMKALVSTGGSHDA
jgi:hypothetical protein